MAFELSLGMGGIFTGRDVEGYSVPGMAGAEEQQETPHPSPPVCQHWGEERRLERKEER